MLALRESVSQTKICFPQSWLHRKMAKIHLSRIESSTFKNLSYAGPSVLRWAGKPARDYLKSLPDS